MGSLRLAMYFELIRAWLTAFPASQLIVIRLEDYVTNPVVTLRKLHKFLEVKELSVTTIESFVK